MHKPHSLPGWRRLLYRFASSRAGLWLAPRLLPPLDRAVLGLTGNRQSASGLISGMRVVMLTTTGAKSGQPRTLPMITFVDGERLALIASNFGREHHPAWYHNLRAHPEAWVTYRGETRAYVARRAAGEEREKYWRQAVRNYSTYAAYARKARPREIQVMVLEPKDESA